MRQKSLKKQLENICHERLPVRDSMALQLFVILNNLYLLDPVEDSEKDRVEFLL